MKLERMKILKILISLQFIFCGVLYSKNYSEGDILNVFAESGLNIRVEANLDSKIIGTIFFGEPVLIKNTFNFKLEYQSKIENLEGNWVKVEYNDLEGFVFDGFLSKLKIPNYILDQELDCAEGIGVIDKYLEIEYGINRYEEIVSNRNYTVIDSFGESAHSFREIVIPELGLCRFHRYHEGLGSEIVFKNLRDSEVTNLAKTLIRKCTNFKRKKTDFEFIKINDDSGEFLEYRNSKSSKLIYFYRKNDLISFMINFYI